MALRGPPGGLVHYSEYQGIQPGGAEQLAAGQVKLRPPPPVDVGSPLLDAGSPSDGGVVLTPIRAPQQPAHRPHAAQPADPSSQQQQAQQLQAPQPQAPQPAQPQPRPQQWLTPPRTEAPAAHAPPPIAGSTARTL